MLTPDRDAAAGRSRLLRGAAVLLGAPTAAALCLLGPAADPALAHARLVDSTPADGATVDAAPGQVVLRFDEPIQASSVQIAVSAPDGSTVDTDAPEVLDAVVSAGVDTLPMAGDYTVGWRVVSADGHPVDGELAFTATATAAAGPAGSTGDAGAADDTPADDGAVSDRSWWQRHAQHVLGGVALVAIGVALWWRERRARG